MCAEGRGVCEWEGLEGEGKCVCRGKESVLVEEEGGEGRAIPSVCAEGREVEVGVLASERCYWECY